MFLLFIDAMKQLIGLMIHIEHEHLVIRLQMQIMLARYRIDQLYLEDEIVQTWKEIAPFHFNLIDLSERCGSSGCPNMNKVDLRCNGCHVTRYCSRECQKRYVISVVPLVLV